MALSCAPGYITRLSCLAVPPDEPRQREDMVILAHIREQHGLALGSYGRPRMTEELKELGLAVGHRRVGRLMKQNGIRIVRTRKYKAMTDTPALRQALTTPMPSCRFTSISQSNRKISSSECLLRAIIYPPVRP